MVSIAFFHDVFSLFFNTIFDNFNVERDEMNELKKEISVFGGISILAGIMIGSGIFALGGIILYRVGYSLGLSLLVWIVGGIITLFSGLTYAELGTMFPETGGYYVYLKKAYGKRVAFLSGLMNFVLMSSGSIAILALLFGNVLSYVVDVSAYVKWIAAGLIILTSVVNYFGVKTGSLVQKFFLVAKLLPIFGIIFVGIFLGNQSVNLLLAPVESVSFFGLLSMIGFGIVGTLFAYEGWTNLNSVAGEMKNVKKDLPKAILVSILLVTVVYVLFIFSIYRILDFVTLQAIANTENYFPMVAFFSLYGETGLNFIFIAVLISIFGALNGSVMVFPRVYYAMAKDQVFFKSFGSLSKKYQTPWVSILGSMLMALILIFFDVETLLTFIVFGALIFNALIFFSVFLFRKRLPDHERPYKVWGYPYVPIIAIIGMVLLMVATFIEEPLHSSLGLGVLVVGYFIFDLVIKKIKVDN
jgi:APA family basic amino acid/polyamine antiporter